MDPAPPKYAPTSPTAVAELVAAQPLAWIVTDGQSGFQATPLPLRTELDSDGAVTALIGHFALRNPQVETLRRSPRALILTLGAEGYISPSWLTDRTQAPSWNYASAQFEVELEFIEEQAFLRHVLDDIIGAMEVGRSKAWSPDEMGERYQRLSRGIVAFRARVLAQRPVFKLGQDERDDVYGEILEGLTAGGRSDLTQLMRLNNPGRS